jgi:hypothetical protein
MHVPTTQALPRDAPANSLGHDLTQQIAAVFQDRIIEALHLGYHHRALDTFEATALA